MTLLLVSTILGTAAVLAWRIREGRTPVSVRKIVIPPLAMSTGFAMFFYPPTRINPSWAVLAFFLGAMVFAYPLIRTSRLTLQGDQVMLKRSGAFLWVLLGLVTIRIALRGYVEHLISPLQTAGLFFILAFGMIVRWRLTMLWEYRSLLARQVEPKKPD